MSIKASASITLSATVDVSAVWRYYLLQSATLNPPAKPTTRPPGGSWTTTEPTYDGTATNALYFVDLTVFSDSSFAYSDVSLSSGYEAAKSAWNKADAALDAAADAMDSAENAQSTADAAQTTADETQAEFRRVVRIEIDGLHIGDSRSSDELLLDSQSLNVRMSGQTYSKFAANYVQFGNYQLRRTADGGLGFKLSDV